MGILAEYFGYKLVQSVHNKVNGSVMERLLAIYLSLDSKEKALVWAVPVSAVIFAVGSPSGLGALDHPLIVLLVGAVVTGLLVPAVTRRWQDRQKELELKTGLVSELSESIMEIVMAVQFHHMTAGRCGQGDDANNLMQELNQAYRTWEVRSAVIATKLRSYFPATTVPDEWTQFSETITLFYALEGTEGGDKQELMLRIKDKLLGLLGPGSVTGEGWGHLRSAILKEKDKLIQNILRSPVAVLRSSWSGWPRR